MNGMKRLTSALATAVCLFGLGAAAYAEPLTIAVANFGDHQQLNAVVEGFRAELAASGYVEGKDVNITVDHVNFDPSLAPQMLSKIEATKPALILTVTTPISQIAKNQLGKTGIPIVFSAVTDPVAAKLVPSWESGDTNMSGASDLQDVNATMEFTRKLLPDAKKFGMPYNPGEANDVALLDIVRAAAPAHGFEVTDVGIDNANDIQQRIASLAGNADVIFGSGSNLIQPAIAAVASAAKEAGIPIVNTDDGPVKQGIVPASFSISYIQIGHNAGKIAVRVLKGEDISKIAPIKPAYEDFSITISKKAMEAFGAKIPDSFADCKCIVD